jgi:zinc/manganese transport system substrate-binding protein
MKLPTALGFVVLLAAQHALALAAAPIEIVAAENFYGDVAEQIGGADVRVTSILSDPAVDPHLFEASPSVARVISGARVVVYNGIDYDPWMATLLAASPVINRRTIVVASLAASNSKFRFRRYFRNLGSLSGWVLCGTGRRVVKVAVWPPP